MRIPPLPEPGPRKAVGVETIGMTMRFGGFTELDDVSIKVPLIGDRIAKASKGELEKQLNAEFAAGDAWLSRA